MPQLTSDNRTWVQVLASMFYLDSIRLAKHQPLKKYLTMYLTNWCNNQKRAILPSSLKKSEPTHPADQGPLKVKESLHLTYSKKLVVIPPHPADQHPLTAKGNLLVSNPPPPPYLDQDLCPLVTMMNDAALFIKRQQCHQPKDAPPSQPCPEYCKPTLLSTRGYFAVVESVQGRKFIRLVFKYEVADDEDLCLLLDIHISRNICLMGMFKDNGIVKEVEISF
ncbi:hypothetical protein C8J57DRAFT_1249695 [Mycena rebaudengoi]|nr:hypothetical protein C8J57DRAFT_1249695 [Mycena rebaudengoi]